MTGLIRKEIGKQKQNSSPGDKRKDKRENMIFFKKAYY